MQKHKDKIPFAVLFYALNFFFQNIRINSHNVKCSGYLIELDPHTDDDQYQRNDSFGILSFY